MNITNQANKATMREALQGEIEKCHTLVEKLGESTKPWSGTVRTLIMMDVEKAEKAIEEKNDSAMFRSLRALRIHNLPNY